MSNKKEWNLSIFKDAPEGVEFAAIDADNTGMLESYIISLSKQETT